MTGTGTNTIPVASQLDEASRQRPLEGHSYGHLAGKEASSAGHGHPEEPIFANTLGPQLDFILYL